MFPALNPQQISFFIILIVAFILFLNERVRNDLVAILIVIALAVTRLLKPDEALAGFSSEPAIVVAGIFVLSAALEQTGVAESAGSLIGRLAGRTFSRAILVIMPAVALLSAFTHHVTTTAIMLPITLNFSRERNIPASKLLMPLSFAASLGTTITIIGAPAFLIASDILRRGGRPGLSVFSITPIGLALSLMGTVFILLVGRFLLPKREGAADLTSHFRVDRYFTELKILPDSPLIGQSITDVKGQGQFRFTVVGLVRDDKELPAPYGDYQLLVNDVLRVHTTPEDLVAFRETPGIEIHPVDKFGDETTNNEQEEDIASRLVQAVVAPASDLIGRTLRSVDFKRRYGAIVVGLWRRRSMIREELAGIRLRAGDMLVLQGDDDALARVERDPAFLMLVPFHGEARRRRHAALSVVIMLATVLIAAFNILPLEIATLAGAAAVVVTHCITPRQAYRSIDVRIFVFIAGAIPLGDAMEKSGVSALAARWLQQAVGGWSELAILLLIFAVVSILTQFMSDSATTALFAPVALALAQALGHAPEAYVVTVAMASIAAFLTPIGHHGNLLVYGPGRYQFADFVKVGTPLTVLTAIVVCVLAMMLWPHP